MYSKEEVKAFALKDLRISKLAIVKSLIEKLPLEEIYDVNKVKELAEKYVDYVYKERKDKPERKETTKRGQVASVGDEAKPTSFADTKQIDWDETAIGLNLAIPNATSIKILNQVADEYKKATKASANPKDILVHIINMFGKYPTKTESVSKVVESFNERLEK